LRWLKRDLGRLAGLTHNSLSILVQDPEAGFLKHRKFVIGGQIVEGANSVVGRNKTKQNKTKYKTQNKQTSRQVIKTNKE
jgi:hypothetical protein